MLTFHSERLIYVPLTSEHVEDFFKMESAPDVLKYYRRDVVKKREESLNNVLVYVKYAMDHAGLGAWAVFAKDSAEFVGIGVIIHLDKNPDASEHEIGYRLPPSEEDFFKLYSWPVRYDFPIRSPQVFTRQMAKEVYPVFRHMLESIGYCFAEE